MVAKSETSIASSGFGYIGDVKNEESNKQEVEADAEGVQGGLRGVAK